MAKIVKRLKSEMRMTIKQQVETLLETVAGLPTLHPTNSSTASNLTSILVWQETLRIAAAKFKAAWDYPQSEGILPTDDVMRQLGEGEHVVERAGNIVLMAKVSKPREGFDRDLFIRRVAKKYKLPISDIEELAEASYTEGNPSLSKRVVET